MFVNYKMKISVRDQFQLAKDKWGQEPIRALLRDNRYVELYFFNTSKNNMIIWENRNLVYYNFKIFCQMKLFHRLS